MRKNARFWRNVTLIALAHVVLIIGLVYWSRHPKRSRATSIVWMGGAPGDSAAAPAEPTATKLAEASIPPVEVTPEPRVEEEVKEEEKEKETEKDRPILTAAKSEIQMPSPKPTTTPTPKPKPKPKPTPTPKKKETPRPKRKAKPKEKSKPKSKPKPKKKSTPKPKKKSHSKKLLAKATPKPTPKAKKTAKKTKESEEISAAESEKRRIAKEALGKSDSTGEHVRKAVAANAGNGNGTSSGAGGHAGGGTIESQFGWYGSMLHDRLYSEWVQPIAVASSGEKFSVLAKLRIEKDGRVSSFEIVKSSGNEVVDKSVSEVAQRVTQVDPLPPGLGEGDHYDVKINFELNSEQ
jgi:TolA protein